MDISGSKNTQMRIAEVPLSLYVENTTLERVVFEPGYGNRNLIACCLCLFDPKNISRKKVYIYVFFEPKKAYIVVFETEPLKQIVF